MIKKILKQNSGYTLLELLLYISVSAVMLLAISLTLSTFLEAKIKNQTVSEIDGEGTQVMQLMTQTIRNATAINSPALGTNDNALSLTVTDPAKSPTLLNLLGTEIEMTEGANPSISLTNTLQSIASNLTFENLSRVGTTGTIAISFTLSHINPSGRNEYNYSRTFYGSATLRQ